MKVVNEKVEMITIHDEKGNIKPVRFRITEKEERKVVQIKRLLKIDEMSIGGLKVKKFYCEVELNETTKLCELLYNLGTLEWSLYRI